MNKITKIFLISGTTLEMIGTVIVISLIFKLDELNKDLEDNCTSLGVCDVIKKRRESTVTDIHYCVAGLCCILVGFTLKVYGYYRE